MKIMIADDHSVVRAGLKQILSEVPDISSVDEAANADELLSKVRRNTYSVIVLDIAMPGKSGLDALKEIRADFPDVPVLILSMYPEDQYAVRVLRAGAAGYMTKDSAPDELVTAIRTVARGRKYVSPSVAERLVTELDTDAEKSPHEMLSDREFQILRLIASGRTVGEIANNLFLSVKTVSTYRRRILDKMHLKNNAELTTYAIQNHLVD